MEVKAEQAAAPSSNVDDDEQAATQLLMESLPANEQAASVTALELFMAPYQRPLGLHHFPQLTSLEIIACGLTSLDGVRSAALGFD